MYERFTDRSRKVMQLANEEALRLNHTYLGTEHILLGLVKEGAGIASNVLRNMDIDLRRLRIEVERHVPPEPSTVTIGKPLITPRSKKSLEYALEEVNNLNHKYVGTEHLLLGLLREREGLAAKVLLSMGLKLEDIHKEILNLLIGEKDDKINIPSQHAEILDALKGLLMVISAEGLIPENSICMKQAREAVAKAEG